MGSEIDHLKLAVLRFFCWINQAFASKQALSMLNRTLCQSGLAELGPVPPSLCGAEFALLVIDLIIARSRSLPRCRAGAAGGQIVGERGARSSSSVLSSLVVWVSRLAASQWSPYFVIKVWISFIVMSLPSVIVQAIFRHSGSCGVEETNP